ncbi:MAG: prepilin-type N-terminal cleavage/methylation domain-containing protein [Desulfobacterales bacterium]
MCVGDGKINFDQAGRWILELREQKGFTLIELMIVIAIIGILSAIAVPNFISYRNKAYCSELEVAASSAIAALGAYFSDPTHTALPASGDLELGAQTQGRAVIGGTLSAISVTVANVAPCPKTGLSYVVNMPGLANDGWQ